MIKSAFNQFSKKKFKKSQNLLEGCWLLKKPVRSAVAGGQRTRRCRLETGSSASSTQTVAGLASVPFQSNRTPRAGEATSNAAFGCPDAPQV